MKKYKLGEICEIVNGATPSTSDISNYDGDIIWFTPKDLSEQKTKFVEKGARNLSKKGFNSCSTHLIPANNILMSSRAPIGLLAINKNECCTNQGFKNLILNQDICDTDYMYYCLKFHIKEIEALGSGTTFKEVSKESLRKFELSLPPLPTQRRIAAVLAALDQKIALNRKTNQTLENMAKQLYDYYFVQFCFPDDNGKPYKASGGKMVYNATLKREVPEEWECGKLSDIANITMGQSPSGKSYNEEKKGIIFYQGSTDFGLRFPSVRLYTTEPSRFAKKGDVLMSVRAPVGAMNIANNDCCIGRGLAALNSKIGSTTHLYFVLDGFRSSFEQRSAIGTTFGSITKDELYGLNTIIPSKEVISAFENLCKPIFDKQMIIGEQISRLTALRDELLPLLMNGQVQCKIELETINNHE